MYGRDSQSKLKIEAITSTLESIGGSVEDIKKITEIIEPLFQQINGT